MPQRKRTLTPPTIKPKQTDYPIIRNSEEEAVACLSLQEQALGQLRDAISTRQFADDPAKLVSVVNALRRLEEDDRALAQSVDRWTRAELHTELRRCRALMKA